jgi:hypothetical protein
MAGTNTVALTNPAVSASGEVDSLLIEKFTGKVHEQYLKGENIASYFDMIKVQNTNKVSNKYLGDTSIQALVPGQEPEANPTEYDKNALVIDTTLLARNAVAMLHDVQQDISDNKGKLAKNQSKQLKKFEDEMLIQQMLHGVISNTSTARSATPRVSGHGFSISLTISDAQALLPNELLASIEDVLEDIMEQEGPEINEMAVLTPWVYFNVLSDAERLVNRDYTTESGVKIKGFTLKRFSIPIIPSNRFPTVANSSSNRNLLSNADNAYRYDVTAGMLDAVAIVFSPEALLFGRSIDLEGDIFWDKKTKSFFIDSWFAEGAIPDRWEAVGAVFGGGSTNAAITARANRKAIITKAIT